MYTCRCYKSSYSFRRCDECRAIHAKKPQLYPLTPACDAFPPRDTRLLLCNICKINSAFRTKKAEQTRRENRRKSSHKICNQMTDRQMEKVARHLRKWRAECVRDNLDPNSKEASRRLSSAKGQASYCGNLAAWHYLEKRFFAR